MENQEQNNPKEVGFVDQIIIDTNSKGLPTSEKEPDPALPLSGKKRLGYFAGGLACLVLAIVFGGLTFSFGLAMAFGSNGFEDKLPLLFFLVLTFVAGFKTTQFTLKGVSTSTNIYRSKDQKEERFFVKATHLGIAVVLALISTIFSSVLVSKLGFSGFLLHFSPIFIAPLFCAAYYNIFFERWAITKKLKWILGVILAVFITTLAVSVLENLVVGLVKF